MGDILLNPASMIYFSDEDEDEEEERVRIKTI